MFSVKTDRDKGLIGIRAEQHEIQVRAQLESRSSAATALDVIALLKEMRRSPLANDPLVIFERVEYEQTIDEIGRDLVEGNCLQWEGVS